MSTPVSKEKPARKKQYAAPALEKGLDILELLSTESVGLSLRSIAERLDRSVGEIFRMLAVLEQREYVSLQPNGDLYSLTLRMFALAHRFPPVKRLTTISGPVLRHLSYGIEQSCHLVIYYEGKGHVVVQQDSPSERVFSVRLGAEAPLANTCSGRLLLAFADDYDRSRMVESIPAHHDSIGPDDLALMVDKVRAKGFEKIRSAQAQGVEDVGYPVFDYTGSVVAALVVPFFSYVDDSHPVDLSAAQAKIALAASEISVLLGYEG